VNPGRIQSIGWFIQNKKFGFVEQCESEAETLTHTKRVFAYATMSVLRKPNGLEREIY